MATTSTNSKLTILKTPILNSKCYKYAEDVCAGKIIASKKVIQAGQRFINDLEESARPDYPWRFDIDKAYRPIDFMERFCKPTKGDFDRMELFPWQHFVEGNLYGWVDKQTDLRRFREGLVVVARGNGKSTMIVGNAEYGCAKDGENGAEVYLLANSKEQAGIIFNECKTQIKDSALLRKHFRPLRDAIYYDKTNSKIQHRASDSKKLDGLSPHLAVFDEIHEFTDWKLINVIKRPMSKKRRNPLIIYITTLGTQLNGPLIDLYVLCSDILNDTGVIMKSVADRIFAYIAEIDENDDVEDTSKWIKANPSMGGIFTLQDLVTDWERAKATPEERNDFINKQLNVFTSVDEMSMFDYKTIQRNNKIMDIAELKGRHCYGGFDLSSSEDFTSACLEFPLPTGDFFVLSHSWTTKKKVEADNEKIDYYGLQEAGYLTIVDKEYIEREYVFDWFYNRKGLYNILSIGYDPANAPFLVQELEIEGFNLNVVRQGALTLNAPIKDIKERFLDGRMVHNNNKMLNWYFSNVKLQKDRTGNWLPAKNGRFGKIDGFAALLDAHTEYMRANPVNLNPNATVASVIKVNVRN